MITRNYPLAKITMKSDQETKVGEIDIYGQIGSDWFTSGIDPADFKNDLDSLGDITILKVRIHSYGGYVYEGQAIKSALRRHKAEKHIFVDGIAASMASSILMEGDKRYCAKNGTIMIHDPLGICIGNLSDMEKYAANLKRIKDQILDDYEEKSSLTREDISKKMTDETWMTAEEALEWGFVDAIGDEIEFSAENHVVDLPGIQTQAKQETTGADFRAAASTYINKLAPVTAFFNLSNSNQEFEAMPQVKQPAATPNTPENNADPVNLDEVRSQAATAERERIAQIQDLSQPGAEEIVEKCINDGSSVGEAAVLIAKAVKSANQAANQSALDARRNGGNEPVLDQPDDHLVHQPSAIAEDDYKTQYEKNVDGCRDEFESLEQYEAFKKAENSGRLKHTSFLRSK